MAWRKTADPFPAPLRVFREELWPPVPGEHLGHYWCCGPSPDPVPEPGEVCGERCYALLACKYQDRPEVVAAAKASDAYTRFHGARLSWLAEDIGGYLDEMIAGWREHDRIRYAPFRAPGGVA